MRSHLTDITVRALKSNDAQFKVWDKSTRGFGILVGKSKSWIVMHGAARKLKVIGRYPDMPLAAARTTAKKVLANGIPDAASLPFDEALETFLTTRPHNKPRTIADYRRLLSKHFLPSFNGRPLSAITTSQILAITDKLIRTPSEHAHAFVAAKVFFSWARSRRHIAHSPMEGLRIPTTRSARARVLSDDELKSIWVTCDGSFGTIVKLLILTGQRRGEIAALRKAWISNETITLPNQITKNGREHTFPIPSIAQNLLKSIVASGEVLFPARGTEANSFNGWSKSKAALDKKLGDTVAPWTLHDLRRTFATNLAALGVPIHVTEKLLNHVSGTTGGLVGIYQRHEFWGEQIDAINKWERRLKGIIEPRSP